MAVERSGKAQLRKARIHSGRHGRTPSQADNRLCRDLDYILDRTRHCWDELRGERIFITGGTGFVGCWLLESFAWATAWLDIKASVVVLSRRPEVLQLTAPHLCSNPDIKFIRGNVRDFVFPRGSFSHIIHAAATSAADTFKQIDPLISFDTVLQGTRRTLDFARVCRAEKLLFVSSGAVYGGGTKGTKISEDHFAAPDPAAGRAAFSEAKRAAECLCALYAERYGLAVKIARCFSFVGPYLQMDIHYAAGNFIRDALAGGPIVVHGDGSPYRSYMYAADLAVWLWTLLVHGRNCRPYNVGSEEKIRIADLARLIGRSCRPSAEVKVGKSLSAPAKAWYVPSTKRARTELALRSGIKLQPAVERTLQFYRLDKKTSG